VHDKTNNRMLPVSRSIWCTGLALLIYLACATLIAHVLTGGRYGFHRDELATLDDARHLAWGYVAYPPLTPFFARVSLGIFGTSLTGFRFFAALADSFAIVLTGLIAREMGGARGAQLMAASAVVPFALGAGTLMQYVSFDYLAWVACAYSLVRLCNSDDPRWWIPIGACIGFGMLTKYTMLVCVVGVVIGISVTDLRQHFRSRWLWIGVVCSLLIFLPNFIWQVDHGFVSLDFLKHIHERDVRIGRTRDFLPDQLKLTLFALPLAVSGLYFCFFSQHSRQFRAVGWLYIVPFAFFLVMQGRGYYLEPAYPVLFAGGSVAVERFFARWRQRWAHKTQALLWGGLVTNISLAAAFMLPLAPINSPWWRVALKINSDFAEEIGWRELVETVAQIRVSLPPNERVRVAILTGNYGEAGAVNLYGPGHGLPTAISGINSFWERGYGNPPPETLIVLGLSRTFLEQHFESCEVAGHLENRYGVANEETTNHSEVFVCRRLLGSWLTFWRNLRNYG